MNRDNTQPAKYLPALCLAVLSPAIAELVSSSTPPGLFFIWWVFLLFVLLYGSSCVLIRELTVRWGAGWTGILVSGAGFAILDEGILTRAFFDPAWPSLGPLAGHGRWFGINVIWTVDAILFHSIFSMALPIQLVDLMFPKSSGTPWLKAWHLWTIAGLLAFVIAVFINAGNKYPVHPLYLASCVLAICSLLLLARYAGIRTARSCPRLHRSSRRFFFLGFGAVAAILSQMYVLPPLLKAPVVTLATLAAIIYTVNRSVRRWTGNGDCWTPSQRLALASGMLVCLAIIGGVQEINPARQPRPVGTSLVAIACICGLMIMRRQVRGPASSLKVATQPMAFAMSAASVGGGTAVLTYGASPVAVADLGSVDYATAPSSIDDFPLAVRAAEIAIASTILIVTLPITLVLAILIRRDTPGPALFFQRRVGRRLIPFTFVKFRTFYVDAPRQFPELYAYTYSPRELATLKFKLVNDPRVTPQGGWMRKSTLDELPNFWNVLTGDMALVGPRPEIPEMLQYYTDEMKKKFSVRPGVTGLAQISGRGRLGFYETVALDLEYVRTRSFFLDCKILATTVFKMVSRDGAF